MNPKLKCGVWTFALAACIIPLLFVFRPVPIAIIYAVVSGTIVGLSVSNIVFDSDSIPDKITLPGILFGGMACAFVPSLMGQSTWKMGVYLSLGGAACTFWVLAAFIELYRRYNGPRRIEFDEETPFVWKQIDDESAILDINGDIVPWNDLFSRDTDEIRMECDDARIDSASLGSVELVFRLDRVIIGRKRHPLKEISKIDGHLTHLSMPRESMGYGVVKAMSAFTAFFGWQGAIFTFLGGALIGAMVSPRISSSQTNQKVPFIPFLSAAAILWMIWGADLLSIYMQLVFPK